MISHRFPPTSFYGSNSEEKVLIESFPCVHLHHPAGRKNIGPTPIIGDLNAHKSDVCSAHESEKEYVLTNYKISSRYLKGVFHPSHVRFKCLFCSLFSNTFIHLGLEDSDPLFEYLLGSTSTSRTFIFYIESETFLSSLLSHLSNFEETVAIFFPYPSNRKEYEREKSCDN